jgi:hypothetical protein
VSHKGLGRSDNPYDDTLIVEWAAGAEDQIDPPNIGGWCLVITPRIASHLAGASRWQGHSFNLSIVAGIYIVAANDLLDKDEHDCDGRNR